MRKCKNYWTKEKCQEEALKYNTRSEYNKNSIGSYCKSWQKNWLDDVCSHMLSVGNKYKKCIYVYEFLETKTAYVGLTYNLNIRKNQHLKNGPVFKYSQNNKTSNLKQLTDYIDVEDAKIKEEYFVIEYKKNNWNILNTAKTGAVGGGIIKWTKEKCIIDAKKYNNKNDYRNNSKSYRAVIRNKWIVDVYKECGFEINKSKPHKYWTKEKCLINSKKYNTFKDFYTKSKVVYSLCQRHKWIDDIKRYNNWN